MRLLLPVAFLTVTVPAPADDADDIAKLTRDLKNRSAAVRLAAVEQLATKGDAATKPLCDSLLDKDVKVATAALAALEAVRPDIYRPLVSYLVDKPGRRQEALKGLAALGEKAKPLGTFYAARIRATAALPPAMNDAAGLWAAFAACKATDADIGKFARPYVLNRRDQYRAFALVVLANWAGEDKSRRKEVVPVLKVALQDEVTVMNACLIAGGWGEDARDLLPTLRQVKLAPGIAVRTTAERAIEMIEAATKPE